MVRLLVASLMFLLGTFSPVAFAYIPPYWMIMSRLAENHGTGHYKVEQRVQFNHGVEPLSVVERWFIQDEDNFRLEAFGVGPLKDKLRLTYIYTNGRRYFVDSNGVRKAEKTPTEFFEPYFHFRRSKVIKPRLVALNIVPTQTLKSESHRYSENNPEGPKEDYVRLSRSGGVVNYAIGTPTPAGAAKGLPGIWIEQDLFHLRKLRFPSGTEVRGQSYQKHLRGAWFPGQRTVLWNNQELQIQMTNVAGLPATKKTKDLMAVSSLNFGEDPKVAMVLPEDELIQKFYLELR